MEQEALFDHIDAYIWHLLTDEERQNFEKNLETDLDLRAELTLRQLENEAFQLADKTQLREKMKAWRAEEAVEKKTETALTETKVVSINQGRIVRFSPMRWAAAAAVALLFVVGGRYWVTTNYGSGALASAFYGKTQQVAPSEEELFGASGAETDATPLLNEAKKAYEAKNYAQATTIYQNIVQDKTVKINQVEEAEWKLLVTYLANNKTNDAEFKALLIKLQTDANHSFHFSALELGQKMNSVWWKLGN